MMDNNERREESVKNAFDGLDHYLDVVSEETFNWALKKGWGGNSDLEDTSLMHCEICEISEACRKDPPQYSQKIPDFLEAEEEAADVLIRLINFCKERGLRLGKAVEAKFEYNKTREFKHGGKKL